MTSAPPKLFRPMFRLVSLLSLTMICALSAHAQDAASPKWTLFVGPGIFSTQGHSKGEVQFGASLDEAPPNTGYGLSIEGGYLGPWSNSSAGAAFFSLDYMTSWHFGQKGRGKLPNGTRYWADRGWRLLPFASAGYTRLFGTGNAVNYGGGFDYRFTHKQAIRIELRDYYAPSAPSQHNLALRIGWVFYIPD